MHLATAGCPPRPCMALQTFVCFSAGYTVLHHAVMGGSADIVGILLFTGHGMADTGRESFTPLHLAAHKGHIDLLPFLPQRWTVMAGELADCSELAPCGCSRSSGRLALLCLLPPLYLLPSALGASSRGA